MRAARPHWPGRSGNAPRELGERVLAGAEGVRLRARGRVDAEALGLRAHGVPDARAARRRARAARRRARSALRRRSSGCAACGAAAKRADAPRQRPSSTHETGIGVLRAGRDEHGDVEDAVLLGADQLLAVVEQHVLVERVRDGELRHEPGRVDLGDLEAERQRLVEREVLGERACDAGRAVRRRCRGARRARRAGWMSRSWDSFRFPRVPSTARKAYVTLVRDGEASAGARSNSVMEGSVARRLLTLRYPAACCVCGGALPPGTKAWWDRETRHAACLVCGSGSELAQELAGTAGGSGHARYERLRERREHEIKGKLGDKLGNAYLFFKAEPQSTRAWQTGSAGEQRLARFFEKELPDSAVVLSRPAHSGIAREHRPHRRCDEWRVGHRRQALQGEGRASNGRLALERSGQGLRWRPRPDEAGSRDGETGRSDTGGARARSAGLRGGGQAGSVLRRLRVEPVRATIRPERCLRHLADGARRADRGTRSADDHAVVCLANRLAVALPPAVRSNTSA